MQCGAVSVLISHSAVSVACRAAPAVGKMWGAFTAAINH